MENNKLKKCRLELTLAEAALLYDLLFEMPQSCIDTAEDFEGTADLVEKIQEKLYGWAISNGQIT